MLPCYMPIHYIFHILRVFLNPFLQRLYGYGARKFVCVGLGVIGCIPAQRIKSQTEECNEEASHWSVMYNEALKSMLQELKSELNGMTYTYFDTYSVMQGIIQNPTPQGKLF